MKNIIQLFISLTLISSISHSNNQCRNLFFQVNPSETEVNILFRNAISDPNLENGISNIQNRFLGALKKIINDNRRRSHEYADGFFHFLRDAIQDSAVPNRFYEISETQIVRKFEEFYRERIDNKILDSDKINYEFKNGKRLLVEGTIQRRHYWPVNYIETIKIKGVLVFLESRTPKTIDLNRVTGDSSEIFKILMEDGSIFTFNSNSDSIYNYNRNGSRSSSLRVSWLSENANSLITSFERLFSELTNANQIDYQNNPNYNLIADQINIRLRTLNGMLDEFTDSTN